MEVHQMIRVLHSAMCPMTFNILYHLSRLAGVLKLTKNAQFSVFLDVGVLSPKFMGRLNREMYWKFMK